MGLFSKKPNADKILDQALADYRNGNYVDCYAKVLEAAGLGSARAYFCKALLIYNDNVSSEQIDTEVLMSLTKKAVDGGYDLAYGFYAFLLQASGDIDGLCKFCAEKNKVKDGVYLSFKASYYFGLYTDEEQADKKTIMTVAKAAIEALKVLDDQVKSEKNIQALEFAYYNPYNKFKLNYTYGHAYYVLMTILYCENDWNTRREFIDSFEKVIAYMPITDEKFRASSLYLKAILDNYLGMSDFKEANRAAGILTNCFDAFSEEEMAKHREEYNELFDAYEEFYDAEVEKRNNRDVVFSDGYADKNDLSLKNIASAIASGVQKWSSSSSNSTTVYTIGGTEYTRGEMGYLYDESGFRSEYRVDDYARLYDENENELGYFNTNGNFISK